jgi:hypothetical protein
MTTQPIARVMGSALWLALLCGCRPDLDTFCGAKAECQSKYHDVDTEEVEALCKEDSRHMRRLAALYDCADEYAKVEECMFETGECRPPEEGLHSGGWLVDCQDAYPPFSDDCFVLHDLD